MANDATAESLPSEPNHVLSIFILAYKDTQTGDGNFPRNYSVVIHSPVGFGHRPPARPMQCKWLEAAAPNNQRNAAYVHSMRRMRVGSHFQY